MFSLYAALVKNLRGVVVFSDFSKDVKARVDWLRKRFRYRDLGVSPSLYKRYSSVLEDYMSGRPFQLLYDPTPKYEGLVKVFGEVTGLDRVVAESFVMSSLYISPLILIDDKLVEEITGLGVKTIYTDKKLGVNDWKLHLRIADYTVLDMYRDMVLNALEVIDALIKGERGKAEELIKARKETVKKDVKRYWRIKSDKGKPFLTYIDLLEILVENIKSIKDIDRDWAAGLSIIPCVHLIEVD